MDARADLYSAGVIFREMLTGRAPGPRFALPSQLVPALSPEIDGVALECLARRPDESYADAGELLAALERLEECLRPRAFLEIREAGSLLWEGTRAVGGSKTFLYVGLALLLIALAALGTGSRGSRSGGSTPYGGGCLTKPFTGAGRTNMSLSSTKAVPAGPSTRERRMRSWGRR